MTATPEKAVVKATPATPTKVTPTYIIAGFERPTATLNVSALQSLANALAAAGQSAKTALQNDATRLNADLATAQSVCQQATALWQTADATFTAGIAATPENIADFQQCLNSITQQTPPLQAAYANAFSDAIAVYNDMTNILANPPQGTDLSAYKSYPNLTTLNTIAGLGSIFNGLAGLAGLASAKIKSTVAPTAQQVAQCMTINVMYYGYDQVLSETCTQQMISWYNANIGTGPQDLITQIQSALGKIPAIGSIISSVLTTFTGNIFNIMGAIGKLDKGKGVTIHCSGLALANPLYNLMTTANLQSEASGTSGGDWYDAIWITAN